MGRRFAYIQEVDAVYLGKSHVEADTSLGNSRNLFGSRHASHMVNIKYLRTLHSRGPRQLLLTESSTPILQDPHHSVPLYVLNELVSSKISL